MLALGWFSGLLGKEILNFAEGDASFSVSHHFLKKKSAMAGPTDRTSTGNTGHKSTEKIQLKSEIIGIIS